MSVKKYILPIIVFIVIHAPYLSAYNQSNIDKILPVKERAEIQNDWLKWRFENPKW